MADFKKVIILFVVFILTFILQIYLFNNLTFFGVKANLLLVFVVAMSIWVKPNITIPYVVLLGILSDLVFSFTIGKNVITYLIVMALTIVLSRVYNKRNIGNIIMIMFGATFLTEYLFWIFDGIKYGQLQNVISVLYIVLKGSVINIALQLLTMKIYEKLSDE